MPNMVQVYSKNANRFDNYPVFDLILKSELKKGSLTFRSAEPFTRGVGSLVCVLSVSREAFIVSEIVTDFDGITEVTCISAWEFMERRTLMNYLRTSSFSLRADIDKLQNYFTNYSRASKYDIGIDFRFAANPYKDYRTVTLDPSTSIYEAVCDSIVGVNASLPSTYTPRPDSNRATVVLAVEDLDVKTGATSIGVVDGIKGYVKRMLPSNPTHWNIAKTADVGPFKVSSRGDKGTWKQNHAYMIDNREFSGVDLYETGIEGDEKKNWGPITIGIAPGEYKASSIELQTLSGGQYSSLTVGRPASFSALGMFITGYVLEKTVSGGDYTNYSVKIQPDHVYKGGRDVTAEWI